MANTFRVYVPLRNDWLELEDRFLRSFKKRESALKYLEGWSNGHILNKKNYFEAIKKNGVIIYKT